MCCGAAVRAESPLGDLDRVEVNLNLISMMMVVVMMVLDRVEVNLDLISKTIVVMMMELVRVEAMRLP